MLQEIHLNISFIFLWSPKSTRPHSLVGCSCNGETFIPSTPFYLEVSRLVAFHSSSQVMSLACLRLKASPCISISKRVKKIF